jgi:hypothetical protein
LSYGIIEVKNVRSVEDVTGIRPGAERLSIWVAMASVHSGHGGAGDATWIEQDAYDCVNVEPGLGSDKRYNVHNRATVIVNAQGRGDWAKLRGGSGLLVDSKDDETVARDVHRRLASRAHMNNCVVMALIRRYFQEKMEEFSIIEGWWHGVLHIKSVRWQSYVTSNDDFVAFGVPTVSVRARSTGPNTGVQGVVVGKYGRVLAPAGASFEAVGQRDDESNVTKFGQKYREKPDVERPSTGVLRPESEIEQARWSG